MRWPHPIYYIFLKTFMREEVYSSKIQHLSARNLNCEKKNEKKPGERERERERE